MPLTMAREGEVTSIKRVGGKEEVRRHLENMGVIFHIEYKLRQPRTLITP